MTQNEIIEMARKVGLVIDGNQSGFDDLKAFTKLVAAKAFQDGYEKGIAGFNEAVSLEREACAKLLDEEAIDAFSFDDSIARATETYAATIRARGEQA